MGLGMAALLLGSAGCAVDASSRPATPPAARATLGQELIDLQKARDAGALTQYEYEMEKQRLLDRN